MWFEFEECTNQICKCKAIKSKLGALLVFLTHALNWLEDNKAWTTIPGGTLQTCVYQKIIHFDMLFVYYIRSKQFVFQFSLEHS